MNTFLTIILSVFPLVGQIRENINEITLNTLSDPDGCLITASPT